MRTKNISAKVQDVDTSNRQVKLYYSIFGVKDSDGDIIRKGALKKTQKEWGPKGLKRIWHLDNHMPTARVGKPVEMGEDSKGAWAVTKVSDTQAGRDLMALYDDGAITEHSFGFEVLKEKKADDGTPILAELKQFEYSSVTWGANMFTETIDVKSEEFENRLNEFNKWQKVLREGIISDESCQLLELQIKQWEQQFKALVQPPQSTDEAAELEQLFDDYESEQTIKTLFYNV